MLGLVASSSLSWRSRAGRAACLSSRSSSRSPSRSSRPTSRSASTPSRASSGRSGRSTWCVFPSGCASSPPSSSRMLAAVGLDRLLEGAGASLGGPDGATSSDFSAKRRWSSACVALTNARHAPSSGDREPTSARSHLAGGAALSGILGLAGVTLFGLRRTKLDSRHSSPPASRRARVRPGRIPLLLGRRHRPRTATPSIPRPPRRPGSSSRSSGRAPRHGQR